MSDVITDMDLNTLCSGLFSDNLDRMGFCKQIVSGWKSNWMPFRFMGRARTIRLEALETSDERIEEGLTFLESLHSGDVFLVEGCDQFAYFGELMTRLSVRQGVSGVIIDGLTRDSVYTHVQHDLPMLFRGLTPVDIKGRGRVAACDETIHIGGVAVEPGQFVFADSDALVVVPPECEEELYEAIQRNITDEKDVIELIDCGASVAEILCRVHEF